MSALLVGSGLLAAACQRVPLLAPSGSTISLVASTTALPVNGTTQIIAQVIEASGTPPQEGTQVTFTTSLGTIQPSSADTDSGGRVTVTFNAGTANGTATISAISGGASVAAANAIKIAVGTAAVGRVNLAASPTLVPATGGTSLITASVFDINGNGLAGSPVSFTTTAGTLSQVFATADGNGVATTTLQTATKATVTASVGAQAPSSGGTTGGTGTTTTTSGTATATVVVDILGAPTLVITPPATPASSGLPATFTFVVTASTTNPSAIRDLNVNWGDGSGIQDLGALSGTATVSHAYRAPGVYTVIGTVTDTTGQSVTVSTSVSVSPTSVTLTISAPSTAPGAGLPAAFTFAVGTLPAGDVVRDVTVDWGDGNIQDLGAISGTTTVTHVYATSGSYFVKGTLLDTAGNSTSVSTSVTVVPTSNPTIIITPTVPVGHPANVAFQVQVTAPSGVGIQDATIDFGDGHSQDLGGLSGTVTVNHTYENAGSYSVTLAVKDTLNRITNGSTSVTIS